MERVGAAVIGAGVVGLACARELAQRGIETIILESESAFGTGTSSRNSEVLHAGLYYPTGSLKARLCVEGSRALLAFCETRGVPHRRCGKLVVVATASQEASLDALRKQAEANGVEGLRLLSRDEARTLEPELQCTAALLSPSTAIVDSHALMLALLGDAERAGAVLALKSYVVAGATAPDGIRLEVLSGDVATAIYADIVVNSAGLGAQRLASRLDGFPAERVPPSFFAKGNYYALARRAPFSRLIYPMPEPGGLGVHLTLDLAGQARFGPDVEWTNDIDYRVDPARAERFYAEVRRYWPALADADLVPAYAGIRPKIAGPGEDAADFMIQGPASHGIPGLVNLFGIESPGLTSSLAIAERACDLALGIANSPGID